MKRLILLTNDVNTMMFTFDCLYFPFQQIVTQEIQVDGGTIDGTPLYEIDFVSSFLLRHPFKHRLFHVVRMDGRELTLEVNKDDGLFEVKFCYPVTRNITIQTSNNCRGTAETHRTYAETEYPKSTNEDSSIQ